MPSSTEPGTQDQEEPMQEISGLEPTVSASSGVELTVIVPARNEEDCIKACLDSLVAQSNEFFQLGREWEILIVDDGSTDQTRAIAMQFHQELRGVIVLDPNKLEKGWTGKANACWSGAQRARGQWLLFTDADTIHEPGNLRRAIHEAEKYRVGVLSYSPKQLVSGIWQRALMPLVFSELALAYPPDKVSTPELRIAAANGQFLLASRAAYDAIGGHASVKNDILEDVQFAYLAKKRKQGLRFRYAADALSTRMYRTLGAMIEGWTKNLALLFGNCLVMVLWRLLDFFLLVGLPLMAWHYWYYSVFQLPWVTAGQLLTLVWLRNLWRFYARVRKSNFPALDCLISPIALPLLAALLYRSWFQNTVLHRVKWKGRTYPA